MPELSETGFKTGLEGDPGRHKTAEKEQKRRPELSRMSDQRGFKDCFWTELNKAQKVTKMTVLSGKSASMLLIKGLRVRK